MSITYYECLPAALFTQQAMRMRRIILSFLARLALTYFPYISQTPRFSGKGEYWKQNGNCMYMSNVKE